MHVQTPGRHRGHHRRPPLIYFRREDGSEVLKKLGGCSMERHAAMLQMVCAAWARGFALVCKVYMGPRLCRYFRGRRYKLVKAATRGTGFSAFPRRVLDARHGFAAAPVERLPGCGCGCGRGCLQPRPGGAQSDAQLGRPHGIHGEGGGGRRREPGLAVSRESHLSIILQF